MTSVARKVLVIALLTLQGAEVSWAAEPKGQVSIVYRPLDTAVAKGVFTVSFIRDGKIVMQDEKPPRCADGNCGGTKPYSGYDLAPGSYDVRVQGEGAITVVKNGVVVNSGENRELIFDLRAGQGVKIIEYSAAGLSPEEIAARIKQLEAAIQELRLKAPK